LLIGGQAGGVLVGLLALGIVIDGNALVGVIEDAPYDLHPRHFGRPRPGLGLGLGLLDRLPLLGSFLFLLIDVFGFVCFFLDFAFSLILLSLFFIHLFRFALAALGGLIVSTQILAVQYASAHKIPLPYERSAKSSPAIRLVISLSIP